jgi:hypothetical protein
VLLLDQGAANSTTYQSELTQTKIYHRFLIAINHLFYISFFTLFIKIVQTTVKVGIKHQSINQSIIHWLTTNVNDWLIFGVKCNFQGKLTHIKLNICRGDERDALECLRDSDCGLYNNYASVMCFLMTDSMKRPGIACYDKFINL